MSLFCCSPTFTTCHITHVFNHTTYIICHVYFTMHTLMTSRLWQCYNVIFCYSKWHVMESLSRCTSTNDIELLLLLPIPWQNKGITSCFMSIFYLMHFLDMFALQLVTTPTYVKPTVKDLSPCQDLSTLYSLHNLR